MVAFRDGSVLAQLGQPDMRIPIAYTLGWPERHRGADAAPRPRADRPAHLRAARSERFPALRLARQALADGGTTPTVLNAANEVAVAAFLAGRLGFLEIAAVVEATLEACAGAAGTDLEQILVRRRRGAPTCRHAGGALATARLSAIAEEHPWT